MSVTEGLAEALRREHADLWTLPERNNRRLALTCFGLPVVWMLFRPAWVAGFLNGQQQWLYAIWSSALIGLLSIWTSLVVYLVSISSLGRLPDFAQTSGWQDVRRTFASAAEWFLTSIALSVLGVLWDNQPEPKWWIVGCTAGTGAAGLVRSASVIYRAKTAFRLSRRQLPNEQATQAYTSED